MKIAIDIMGGDHAPEEMIKGALLALKDDPSLELLLVGGEKAFADFLPELPPRAEKRISATVMSMDESVENLRNKKDSSIYLATEAVADHEADAVVSCGSTAAQMAAAVLLLGRIKGVKRPALVVPYPTLKGNKLMLDGGANADVTSANLMDFAVLGNAYYRMISGVDRPEVVLLSNGTEAHKGNAVVRETHQLLSETDFLNFKGNIEGRDIIAGDYDVLVTDGFTGNVVVKVTEGVAMGLFRLIKEEITATASRKVGAALVKPGLKNIAKKFDYSTVGGMPLLGVGGISIVCHGSSNAEAVRNAVKGAVSFVEQDFIDVLANDVARYREQKKQSEV